VQRLQTMLGASPQVCGFRESRWTLRRLKAYLAPAREASLVTISHLLHRRGLSYKRGRGYLHYPDPLQLRKLDVNAWVQAQMLIQPQPWVLLYSSELTPYTRTSVCQGHD